MKIIKYLFFLLLIVILAGAAYIYTKDGTFQIEESKVIDAPDELLFSTINEYKTWEKWGPWMDDSDDMILSYNNQTSGKAASYSWTSETQGDGKMKTMDLAPFTSIDQKITFATPMGESISDVYWKFEKTEGAKTNVTWGIKGEHSFMEKIFWMMQDKSFSESMRPMYTEGLENIDVFVKEKMKEYSVNVDGTTEHSGGFYMYSATASSISHIPIKTKQMFPALKAYINQNSLPQTGMPFTLFNEFNQEQGTAIYSTCIPVREKVITPIDSNILCGTLPQQKTIKTTLNGDYINLKEAWETGYKYIADNGLEINPEFPAFEVYRVGPDLQPNPAAWITEIFIPIK